MENIYDALAEYTGPHQDLRAIQGFLEQGQVDFPCCDGDPAWLYAMACGDLEPFKLCLKFKSVLAFDAYIQGSILATAISMQIAHGDEPAFFDAVFSKAVQEVEADGRGQEWLSKEVNRLIMLKLGRAPARPA